MYMVSVLFDELFKSYTISAQCTEAVEDSGLTGMEEGQVLRNLWGQVT